MIHVQALVLAFLCNCCYWIALSKGASVDLSVADGSSLVGERCPGLVTLQCEAVNINFLRWNFNNRTDNNHTIIIYSANDPPSQTVPSQPAFTFVELVNISQSTVNPNRANYSSVLIANLSLLESTIVMDIECGDRTTFKILQVDVEIIQRSPPRNPSIVMVTADYQSEGQLDSVTVEWRKSTNYCPDYGLNFSYQVNISSESSTMVEHDSTAENCVTEFTDVGRGNEDIVISIMAFSELGTSDLVVYPFVIGRNGRIYFSPRVFISNNIFMFECVSSTINVATNSVCSVRYTTDPMYTGLSDPLNTTLDTPLAIAGLNISITYYFEFSLLVNNSLTIVERTNFTAPISNPSAGLTGGEVAGIVIGSVLLIAIIILLVILIVILTLRGKKGRLRRRAHTIEEHNSLPQQKKVPRYAFWRRHKKQKPQEIEFGIFSTERHVEITQPSPANSEQLTKQVSEAEEKPAGRFRKLFGLKSDSNQPSVQSNTKPDDQGSGGQPEGDEQVQDVKQNDLPNQQQATVPEKSEVDQSSDSKAEQTEPEQKPKEKSKLEYVKSLFTSKSNAPEPSAQSNTDTEKLGPGEQPEGAELFKQDDQLNQPQATTPEESEIDPSSDVKTEQSKSITTEQKPEGKSKPGLFKSLFTSSSNAPEPSAQSNTDTKKLGPGEQPEGAELFKQDDQLNQPQATAPEEFEFDPLIAKTELEGKSKPGLFKSLFSSNSNAPEPSAQSNTDTEKLGPGEQPEGAELFKQDDQLNQPQATAPEESEIDRSSDLKTKQTEQKPEGKSKPGFFKSLFTSKSNAPEPSAQSNTDTEKLGPGEQPEGAELFKQDDQLNQPQATAPEESEADRSSDLKTEQTEQKPEGKSKTGLFKSLFTSSLNAPEPSAQSNTKPDDQGSGGQPEGGELVQDVKQNDLRKPPAAGTGMEGETQV